MQDVDRRGGTDEGCQRQPLERCLGLYARAMEAVTLLLFVKHLNLIAEVVVVVAGHDVGHHVA